jgi:hypothetical protein
MEFSDYGVKVDVTAPPADQVAWSKSDRPPAGQAEHKPGVSASPVPRASR